MDIPSHLLSAIETGPDSSRPAPRRIKSTGALSAVSNNSSALNGRRRSPKSTLPSAKEDESSASDSDLDHDYQTDFTTPAHSETHNCPEDLQSGEVEDFREREYPQLKGKTYLDHGGTTVRIRHEATPPPRLTRCYSSTQSP